jgi:response regulator RpfG family c-di-GMP phosphodiesterase
VVDFFDAVTSQRVYKLPWAKEAAFDVIAAGSGSLFDPAVAQAFLKMMNYSASPILPVAKRFEK